MKIAVEGLRFILPSLGLALLFLLVGWWLFSVPFFLMALAFLFFFRDPRRIPPPGEGLVLSPADGRVIKIEPVSSPQEGKNPATTVSIFLSLFDVHLTRSPISGIVQETEYKPGKFFRAYKDEAHEQNESHFVRIKGEKTTVCLKQIVGVAARRVKCFVRQGQAIRRGQKIGLMYFGSRVEVALPSEVRVTVHLDQKVKGGSSVIGEVKP